MKKFLFAICAVVIALWLTTPPLTQALSVQPVSADSDSAKYQSLVQELKMLQEGLAVKQAELAKLRRKWTTSKGRTPTEQELKEFEKKRAKGEVKVEDNPYVNKTPLSSPGRWREAYYEKLAEINKDKERSIRLEKELALKP